MRKVWAGLLLWSTASVVSSVALCSAAHAGSEVSRSRGRAVGVVVLWPRIVPETDDPEILALASRMQAKLQAAATASVVPSRVDVRPKPERVCPAPGCRGASIGLMLGHQGGGCAAIALVGPPGPTTQRLVPLAGKFQMPDAALTYRQPPEGKVIVSEFVPCGELEAQLDGQALTRLVDFGQGPVVAPVAPAATTTPAPAPASTAPAPAPVPAKP